MKILILGANGMLGNQLMKFYSEKYSVKTTFGTYRKLSEETLNYLSKFGILLKLNDANNFQEVSKLINEINPELIINCIGIIKQYKNTSPERYIHINGLFPQLLSRFCLKNKIYYIQPSTDCVFNGQKGDYEVNDTPDADDWYGKSKLLGEVANQFSMTLRTSIIGFELTKNPISLLGWFVNSDNPVKGYLNAYWSGITTLEFAKLCDYIYRLKMFNTIEQIGLRKISKYNLLLIIANILNKDTKIEKYDNEYIDRSLITSSKLIDYSNNLEYNGMIKELFFENDVYMTNDYIDFKY